MKRPETHRFASSAAPFPFKTVEDAAPVLGGKGAGLVWLAHMGFPVPPGFVVPTFAGELSDVVLRELLKDGLGFIRDVNERKPFKVAVRSGAPVSMPGMMDTKLDVSATIGAVHMCAREVLASWHSERAVAYRAAHGLPDKPGTAVVVQQLVRPSKPTDVAGVLFTSDPNTGAAVVCGEFVTGQLGDALVSGKVTPWPLERLASVVGDALAGCTTGHATAIERLRGAPQEIEFAIVDGMLWLLQVRAAKMAHAAVLSRLVADYPARISASELLDRVTLQGLRDATTERASSTAEPFCTGLPASPGVGRGRLATTRDTAEAIAAAGGSYVYVAHETRPEDFTVMQQAAAIVTARGGWTSHAAVVARALGKPCVVGCGGLHVRDNWVVTDDGATLTYGHSVAVCGTTGRVWDASAKVEVSSVGVEAVQLVGELVSATMNEQPLIAVYNGQLRAHVLFADALVREDWEGIKKTLWAMCQLPSRAGLVLDFSMPASLLAPVEASFYGSMFGVPYPQSHLVSQVLKLLTPVADQLHSAVVITSHVGLRKELRALALQVPVVANTVSDLLSGDPVVLTQEFVEQVLGDSAVLDLIRSTAESLGRSLRVVEPGVPALSLAYAFAATKEGSKCS